MEQLRQEKIEAVKFIAPGPGRLSRSEKKINVPSQVLLNTKAKEIQVKLSEQGKFVTWQEIIYELLEFYGCQHVGELGLSQVDNLEAINQLLRLQRRIDTFVIAYESRVPLITILDLEKLICSDYNFNLDRMNSKINSFNKITKFEELFLGPLIKNQLVRRIFHIEDEIKSIKQMKPVKGSDVLKLLVSYLRDNDLWGAKVKQNEFEAFIAKRYLATNIKNLGVKITNIGNLIGSLKSTQHLYAEAMKANRQGMEDEFKVVIENEREWLYKQLNEKLALYNQHFEAMHRNATTNTSLTGIGNNFSQQQFNSSLSYLKMDSADLIHDLLKLYEKMLDRNELNNIKPFLSSLQNNTYLRG